MILIFFPSSQKEKEKTSSFLCILWRYNAYKNYFWDLATLTKIVLNETFSFMGKFAWNLFQMNTLKLDCFEEKIARITFWSISSGSTGWWTIITRWSNIKPICCIVPFHLLIKNFEKVTCFFLVAFILGASQNPVKVIHPKYSKHWPYTVAHTIDCVCSKLLNHGWNHRSFLSLFNFLDENTF